MEISTPLLAIVLSFSIIFFQCEFGDTVTNQFEMFSDELYRQCDWFMYPSDMKKMYFIFQSYAQQPARICGYGNTMCIRDTFKTVISSIDKIEINKLIASDVFLFHVIYHCRRPKQALHILWHFVQCMIILVKLKYFQAMKWTVADGERSFDVKCINRLPFSILI